MDFHMREDRFSSLKPLSVCSRDDGVPGLSLHSTRHHDDYGEDKPVFAENIGFKSQLIEASKRLVQSKKIAPLSLRLLRQKIKTIAIFGCRYRYGSIQLQRTTRSRRRQFREQFIPVLKPIKRIPTIIGCVLFIRAPPAPGRPRAGGRRALIGDHGDGFFPRDDISASLKAF
ncbi:hypothetical protein EVAR_42532_1 [Eumeta japonica]|uniref:Uncharacterized protein n=1 Tax=Eumeta variegata TaxID=151549 RepID=A0A4C1WUU2_EUMVA|nr:hypothetical protein EVAR_42532_1 [Eumeta japonica]